MINTRSIVQAIFGIRNQPLDVYFYCFVSLSLAWLNFSTLEILKNRLIYIRLFFFNSKYSRPT